MLLVVVVVVSFYVWVLWYLLMALLWLACLQVATSIQNCITALLYSEMNRDPQIYRIAISIQREESSLYSKAKSDMKGSLNLNKHFLFLLVSFRCSSSSSNRLLVSLIPLWQVIIIVCAVQKKNGITTQKTLKQSAKSLLNAHLCDYMCPRLVFYKHQFEIQSFDIFARETMKEKKLNWTRRRENDVSIDSSISKYRSKMYKMKRKKEKKKKPIWSSAAVLYQIWKCHDYLFFFSVCISLVVFLFSSMINWQILCNC